MHYICEVDDEKTERARTPYALIIDALVAILYALSELPESPRTRELRAKAQSYEKTIKVWETVAPSEAQRSAMLDLVSELHAKVRELKLRKKLPRSTR